MTPELKQRQLEAADKIQQNIEEIHRLAVHNDITTMVAFIHPESKEYDQRVHGNAVDVGALILAAVEELDKGCGLPPGVYTSFLWDTLSAEDGEESTS